jgi:hypothetical protein
VIPAALLNFLAGLAAGAGINLLTSIEGGSTAPKHEIVTDSLIWVIAATCLAYAAHLTEGVENRAAQASGTTLNDDDKRALLKDEAYRVRWRYRFTITMSGATSVAASILIPNLLKY